MKKVIIFTDMGIDDALALSFAFMSKKLEIVAIFVSGGNVVPSQGLENLGLLLNLLHVPKSPLILKGRSKPLRGEFPIVKDIHGSDGFGNITKNTKFKNYLSCVKTDKPKFLATKILQLKEEVTIISLSPLTDLALFLGKHAEVKEKVREVIVMGGGIKGYGNITPCAEFNIYSDPKAADLVLKSGLPIVLVPLDATMSARLTKKDLEKLESKSSNLNRALADMLRFYFKFHSEYELFEGSYAHDALAIGIAIDQAFVSAIERLNVDVEVSMGLTYGQTVADLRERARKNESNISVVLKIDNEMFIDWLLSVLCTES